MRHLFLLLLCFLLPAASGSHAATLTLKPCHVEGTKAELRCGTMRVPENRSIKGGRQIALEVLVAPALKQPADEPLFFLSGGPGQDATQQTGAAGSWVNETRDVVLVALRGTGRATLLACELGGTDEHPEEYMEPLFHDGPRYADCARALAKKADLTQYTTMASMQDLDDVRKALGYGKIDLYGGSYGTRAGIVYMHMFPGNVRMAIFSGLVPVSDRGPLWHARWAERALETTLAQCAAEAACHKAFPDPKGDLDVILAALRKTPAPITLKNPKTGKPFTTRMTASGFADGLRVMLYDETKGRRIPLLLKGARGGDFLPFAKLALENNRGLKQEVAAGLMLSVTCPEDVARIRPEEVAAMTKGSFIGDARVRGQMAACQAWPKAPLPEEYTQPFTNRTPVLLISGNLDPVTPPPFGEEARKSFPNSLHVVVPGGHVSDHPCIDAMIKQFLATANPKAIDTSCVAKIKLPPFALKA